MANIRISASPLRILFRLAGFTAGVIFALGLAVSSGRAQPVARLLTEPSELEIERSPMRGGSDLFAELELVYADNEIFNPATGSTDKVRLRSYNGKLVGPTIRMAYSTKESRMLDSVETICAA